MFDLKAYLAQKALRINQALASILKTAAPDRLLQAMSYSLMAGGKRIRPILCLAAAESIDGDPQEVLPAACALEMIHTYSLIHDDLPAMDDDDMRRGQPTCHKAFDEATAILAGDALLTLAFQILSSSVSIKKPEKAKQWLRVIQLISHAAGYCGMIQGQMLDMVSESKQLTLAELKSMHRLKTGALIEASVRCGAELAGVNSTQIQKFESYAQNIGLAFQVTDDILNVEGDPEIMGKAVGTDEQRSKTTYPALLGLAESKAFADQLVENALVALNAFDHRAEPLRAIARYIRHRNR